ncbi:MAG: GNAT family N-acetyltransferase [Bacteroidota bacterium]
MILRLAKMSDIDKILLTTKACAQHMYSQGIFQWNEHYPSRAAFEKDVSRNELHVSSLNESIIAGIVISTVKDQEYEDINWLTQGERHTYIHRVFVHPDHQGQGIAQQMMSFAESQAKTQGHASVRLDTFSQNQRNQVFYEKRGYQRLGSIFFPKQSEHPFYCYELVL